MIDHLFAEGDAAAELLRGDYHGQVYVSARDRQNEHDVAVALERDWCCSIRPFAPLAVLDYWAEYRDAMLAVIEIKSPPYERGRYPYALLSIRKYQALAGAAQSFDCAAVAAFRYLDGIYYASLAHVDPRRTRVVRRRDRHSDSAVEPCVLIPIGQLTEAGAS